MILDLQCCIIDSIDGVVLSFELSDKVSLFISGRKSVFLFQAHSQSFFSLKLSIENDHTLIYIAFGSRRL